KMSQQVLAPLFLIHLPPLPGAVLPGIEPPEQFHIPLLLDFREPGVEGLANRSSPLHSFPVLSTHPAGGNQDEREMIEDERPKEHAIAPVNNRAPDMSQSGERLFPGQLLKAITQRAVVERSIQQAANLSLKFFRRFRLRTV